LVILVSDDVIRPAGPTFTVDHHRVEPLLAAEVFIDDGLGDIGAQRDLLDGGALVPRSANNVRATSIS